MNKLFLSIILATGACSMAASAQTRLVPDVVKAVNTVCTPAAGVALLNDDNPVSFCQANGNRATVVFHFSAPARATYYTLTSADVNPDEDPVSWTVSGSDDQSEWTVVDKKQSARFYSRFQEKAFRIESPSAYSYYKFELESAGKTNVALSGISLFNGKFPLSGWENFIYPEVNFVDKNDTVAGSKIYHRLIQDPLQFISDHAQKVASILYWTDKDERMDVRKINYELRPDKGISAKGGEPPVIDIFYSADWVEKTARTKGDADVLYETRGVLYHELTHAYQFCPKGCGGYHAGNEYFAFIEGLADAVRFEAGFFPVSSRKPGGSWMDGYRTTGFFLQWLTGKDPDFLRKFNRSAVDINPWSFDAAMKSIFGEDKSIQELWNEYQNFLQGNAR